MQISVDSRRKLLFIENQSCLKLSLVPFTHTQQKKNNPEGKTFLANERPIKASETGET